MDNESTTFFQMPPAASSKQELATNYYSISGSSLDDCVFLGQRFDEDTGFRVRHSESWVLSTRRREPDDPTKLTFDLHLGTRGWFTGLWRSTSGRVFVSEASGRLYQNPNLNAAEARHTWDTDLISSAAWGVWGLHDEAVYVWGDRSQRPSITRWDGEQWHDFPPPPFPISVIRGLGEDELWAAGRRGGLARWDGATWHVYATRTREDLLALHIVTPEHIYVGGNLGTVFEGSRNGIFPIGTIPGSLQGDLQDITYWGDELWIACGPVGLFRRVEKTDRFECVDERLDTYKFDTRVAFLAVTSEQITQTPDGVDFARAGMNILYDMRDGIDLGTI